MKIPALHTLLITALFLCAVTGRAQQEDELGHFTTTQADLLDIASCYLYSDTVHSITYSGPLGGEDLRFLREKSGGYYKQYSESFMHDSTLHALDLSAAWFQSGFGAYVVPSFCDTCSEPKLYINERTVLPRFALADCKALTQLTLPKCLTAIESGALQNLQLKNISIPDCVERIEAAMTGCSLLQNVSLPASLREISGNVFDGDNNLTVVSIATTVPPEVTDGGEFDEKVTSMCTLKVPANCADLYARANGWKDFKHIVGANITAISQPKTLPSGKLIIYNASGQRISSYQKGVNVIINGRGKAIKVLR